jgi:ubiquinone/menaquinone biosynthesis C-methylase UbiE
MPIWLWVVVVVFALFVGLSLFWRYGARRTHVPCPAWLAWTLAPGTSERPFGRSRAIDELMVTPGMRVVDVGCGPGRLTLPIARRVGPDGEVVALDMQPKMLERMARRIEKAGLTNVRPLLAGAGDGTLSKDYFDRAVLSTVLGEIPDRERALREIHDALKPGGYLVVAEVIGDPHYQFRKKVIGLAQRAGLRPGEIAGGFFAYTMRLYRPS